MNASLARRARCCSSHAARQPLRRRCRHRLQLHAAAASTFAALGIDERVCEALASSGMHAPTEIQVKAAEPLLARRSTLVAAETGSGKTVAYLAPLLHNLLADDEAGGEGGSRGRRSAGPRLLVLTPNRSLCAQVESVAGALIRAGGLPLACSARHAGTESGRRGSGGAAAAASTGSPAVMVSSPRALLPPGVTPPLAQLSCVVMDEGDLLLREGYVKDVARLLVETRVRLHRARRRLIALCCSSYRCSSALRSVALAQRESGSLPQLVVVAASLWPTGGTVWNKAVRRSALKKLLTSMDRAVSDGLHRRTTGLEEQVVWVDTAAERWPTLVSLLGTLGPSAHVMVFVTAPAEADATARHLRAELPGDCVDICEQAQQAPGASSSEQQVTLGAPGVWRVGSFHAKRTRAEQALALAQFGEGKPGSGLGCVLVCTDALARGIDMARPVDVVVQLGPAENGSAHLHRVGRTARQGQRGVAVTIACREVEVDAGRVAAGQRAVLQEKEEEEQRHQQEQQAAPGSSAGDGDGGTRTRATRAAGRALASKADRRRQRQAAKAAKAAG